MAGQGSARLSLCFVKELLSACSPSCPSTCILCMHALPMNVSVRVHFSSCVISYLPMYKRLAVCLPACVPTCLPAKKSLLSKTCKLDVFKTGAGVGFVFVPWVAALTGALKTNASRDK
jgi:hypothetical protein